MNDKSYISSENIHFDQKIGISFRNNCNYNDESVKNKKIDNATIQSQSSKT